MSLSWKTDPVQMDASHSSVMERARGCCSQSRRFVVDMCAHW